MLKKSFAQDCLYTAIMRLMKEKDVHDITVKELVLKAGVSRSTFYRYYAQPMDVLRDYLQPFNDNNAHLDDEEDKKVYLRRFYQYYTSHSELIYALVQANKTEFLRETIGGHILEVFTDMMTNKGVSSFLQKASVGLCVEILIVWIINDRKEKIEEMTDTVHNMVSVIERVS